MPQSAQNAKWGIELEEEDSELWVILLLITSGVNVTVILVYQVFIVCRAARSSPSRRHLFLSQTLLLGLLLGSSLGFAYSQEQSVSTCVAIRLGTGLSYVLIYSSLLVKQIFLISLNTGVYLPAMYQALLFSFCVLVQVVIGVQWLVLVPPCQYGASDHILALSYIIFLILFICVLAIRSHHIKDNYGEASHMFLLMLLTVPLWVTWMVCALVLPDGYHNPCLGQLLSCPGTLAHITLPPGFGLVISCLVTFVVMFLPRSRQLAALGEEGVYVEDREDTAQLSPNTSQCHHSPNKRRQGRGGLRQEQEEVHQNGGSYMGMILISFGISSMQCNTAHSTYKTKLYTKPLFP